MTDSIWKATTPSGKVKYVQPKDVVPFKAGIVIEIFNNIIKIK